MNKKILVALLVLVACLALAACVPDDASVGTTTGDDNASSAASPGLGAAVPDFLDLVLVYETRIDPGWGGVIKERPIMRFDNGLFTGDLTGVLATGVAESQRKSPELWGEWQGDPNNDSLELQDGGYSEFAALIAGQKVDSVQPGLALDQCYVAQNSTYTPSPSLGEHSSSLQLDTFCFQPNGVFANEVSSPDLTPEKVGGSSRDDAGLYEIDGHTIRLTYGNGDVVYDLFGVYSTPDRPLFSITVGSTVFSSPNDS